MAVPSQGRTNRDELAAMISTRSPTAAPASSPAARNPLGVVQRLGVGPPAALLGRDQAGRVGTFGRVIPQDGRQAPVVRVGEVRMQILVLAHHGILFPPQRRDRPISMIMIHREFGNGSYGMSLGAPDADGDRRAWPTPRG